ncbi:MAG: ferritin, partial [Thermoleophilaceae bacterium]|nr:ferritin [Thermoleophilaceae bacterium]
MTDSRFAEALHAQIGRELGAGQQYLAVAVYYDGQTLPQLATFFYAQAAEERGHALMMVRYLLDRDAPVTIPGVEGPHTEFEDIVAPVRISLEQEKRVSGQISELAAIAREAGDYLSEQFMGWFLAEQVEEEATMSALLDIVERCRDRPMEIEQYLGREALGGG